MTVRLAANISMLFAELPLLDRFGAAAAAGFQAVELMSPYDHSAAEIAQRLERHGLELVFFDLPTGGNGGEHGLACLPGREAEFRRGVEAGMAYAREVGCRRLHAMPGAPPPGSSDDDLHRTYLDNLRFAAGQLARHGMQLLIEPANRRDMPGWYLRTVEQALDVVAAVGVADLKVLFDAYHVQVAEGDLARRLEAALPHLGHVQVAGNPGRHEPDEEGEVNTAFLLRRLECLGYCGWVGCEYHPRAGTKAGLGWAEPYGLRGAERVRERAHA